jgi:hypothetical protein
VPMEVGLPYALFCENVRMSEVFATKAEAWAFAEKSGLVNVIPAHDEDPPRHVLSLSHSIRNLVDHAANGQSASGHWEAA